MNRVSAVFDMALPIEPVFEEIDCRTLGPQGVDMDIEATAWAQDPQDFFNGRLDSVNVVEDTQSFTGQFNVAFGDVHACRNRAMLSKLEQVSAGAAADFEHTLAGVVPEFSRLIEPEILPISFLFRIIERRLVPMRLC